MSEEPKFECGICGLENGPSEACSTCKGTAPRKQLQHTLSEVRSGKVKQEDRYTKVGPKTTDPLWSGTE